MKFGAKILDPMNIAHFTNIVSTVSKLCGKSSNNKTCVLRLTTDTIYFILPEFAANNIGNGGIGRTSFWMTLDPKSLFEFYVCEGKSSSSLVDEEREEEENFILLEIQPESLFRALHSTPNVKMVRIKLTKRQQSPCLTVELDLYSVTSKASSRTITHDIPVNLVASTGGNRAPPNELTEPDVSRTTLSIQLPPVKLIKHMCERMKTLNEFVFLEATNKGTLTLKIDADAVSVCSYFRNLNNLPVSGGTTTRSNNTTTNNNKQRRQRRSVNPDDEDDDEENHDDDDDADQDDHSFCSVRLSLKRLCDFINALQFQPSKIICNFVNHRYAHFFVVHEDDLVLQYLISSVLA